MLYKYTTINNNNQHNINTVPTTPFFKVIIASVRVHCSRLKKSPCMDRLIGFFLLILNRRQAQCIHITMHVYYYYLQRLYCIRRVLTHGF